MLKSKVLNIIFLLKSKVLNIMFLLKSKVLNIKSGGGSNPAGRQVELKTNH